MSPFFNNLQVETALPEVIYFIFGAIANAWFQTFPAALLWGYNTGFIDKYKDNSFIYFFLFFGMSYIIGFFLREVGSMAHNFIYSILNRIGYISIFAKYYLKDSYKLAEEDKEDIIRKFEQKSNKNHFYSLFERNRARYIGYKVITGFLAINFLFTTYAVSFGKMQEWYLPLVFFVLFLVSAHYVSKTSKSLSKFVTDYR